MSMSKLSRGLFLGLFLISGLLYGRDANFYVHIFLLNATDGWQESSDLIAPPVLREGRDTAHAKFYEFYIREDSESVELFAPDASWEINAFQLDDTAFMKHRDNYTLMKFKDLPKLDGTAKARKVRSRFIADSFIAFFDRPFSNTQ